MSTVEADIAWEELEVREKVRKWKKSTFYDVGKCEQ